MSDITMCEGIDCPIRSHCYRFKAIPEDYQHYFIETPYEYDYCEKFISYKDEIDIDKMKFVNTREQEL
jgi:hypothetical protein